LLIADSCSYIFAVDPPLSRRKSEKIAFHPKKEAMKKIIASFKS
jgi:hypothetical protein